jgi:membrane associated rhomboid family serine protease
MLSDSKNDRGHGNDYGLQSKAPKSVVKIAIVVTAIAAILGSFLGLVFSAANSWDKPVVLALIGGGFGAIIGLVTGLLLGNVRRWRELSRLKLTATFAFLGSVVGALSLAIFSEGLAMAAYLAMEGAVAGALIGVLMGIIIPRFWLKNRKV